MYQGASEELKIRIQNYNSTGDAFMFNLRDLEGCSKTFKGSNGHDFTKDFVIASSELKTKLWNIVQQKKQAGDDFWQAPKYIYFHHGINETILENSWLVIGRQSIYEAAKNGSNLAEPAYRSSAEIMDWCITIPNNLWKLLSIENDSEEWKKIIVAEESKADEERQIKKEKREKLWEAKKKAFQEIYDLYREKAFWDELEFTNGWLEHFLNDKCECEIPGDCQNHIYHCLNTEEEVADFKQAATKEINQALAGFNQLKEQVITEAEAKLRSEDLTEEEMFNYNLARSYTIWEEDWREKVRKVKSKEALEINKGILFHRIERMGWWKKFNKDNQPTNSENNEGTNPNPSPLNDPTDSNNQNQEDEWEKQQQEQAEREQAAREKEEQRRQKAESEAKKNAEAAEQKEAEERKTRQENEEKWKKFQEQEKLKEENEPKNGENDGGQEKPTQDNNDFFFAPPPPDFDKKGGSNRPTSPDQNQGNGPTGGRGGEPNNQNQTADEAKKGMGIGRAEIIFLVIGTVIVGGGLSVITLRSQRISQKKKKTNKELIAWNFLVRPEWN